MKTYRYYIAFCYQTKNEQTVYGNVIINNKEKLSIETVNDIKAIEEYIIDCGFEGKHLYIKNVVIMDFRELKGDD